MKRLWLSLALLALAGCGAQTSQPAAPVSDENPRTQRVLEEQGYKEVKLTGMPFYGCSDDDSMLASSNFTAKSPAGADVNGTVCCGLLLKGCTVRTR